jgi:hypothetical protein
MQLAEAPAGVIFFIPPELEKQMAEKAVGYRGIADDRLLREKWQTVFEIDKLAKGWNVKVVEQRRHTQ